MMSSLMFIMEINNFPSVTVAFFIIEQTEQRAVLLNLSNEVSLTSRGRRQMKEISQKDTKSKGRTDSKTIIFNFSFSKYVLMIFMSV